MSANTSGQIQLVNEKGWRRGSGNLLRGEYSLWFKSSRWLKHVVIWFATINGMMAIMVIVSIQEAKSRNEGPPALNHVRHLRRDVRRLWRDGHHAARSRA